MQHYKNIKIVMHNQ